MIVSTTLEDAALALTNFDLDPTGLRAAVERRYPGNAEKIIALYHPLARKNALPGQAEIVTTQAPAAWR